MQTMKDILKEYETPVKEQFIYLIINNCFVPCDKFNFFIKKGLAEIQDGIDLNFYWNINAMLKLSEIELLEIWNSLEKV